MRSNRTGPVNIGSDEMVTINQHAGMVMKVPGKRLSIRHIPGTLGVQRRNSDNRLIKQKLGWAPDYSLVKGISTTYAWIESQVSNGAENAAA